MENTIPSLKPYLWKFIGIFFVAQIATAGVFYLLEKAPHRGHLVVYFIALAVANSYLLKKIYNSGITNLEEKIRKKIIYLTTSILTLIESVLGVAMIVGLRITYFQALNAYNTIKSMSFPAADQEKLQLVTNRYEHLLSTFSTLVKAPTPEFLGYMALIVIVTLLLTYSVQLLFWSKKLVAKRLQKLQKRQLAKS